MNKLVSKNPIQRFKQGKKIVKGQYGLKPHEILGGSVNGETVGYVNIPGKGYVAIDSQAMENNKNKRDNIQIKKQKPEISIKKEKIVSQSTKPKQKFITTSGAFIPLQIQEKASESIRPIVEEAGDFIGHNPAALVLEDLDRANSNRLTETLFGIRPFKGRTITKLPSLQTEELKKQVQFARKYGKNGFDANMYKLMYGHNYASRNGENGQDRSGFWNRMNTPKGRLEHTLGAYSFYTDDEGNTIVHDIYDFNDGQKQGGDGRYSVTRNFMGEFGSHSSDPNEGKIKYRINLGKL